MNSWLAAMKQWTQWLMGDAPLPDGRSTAVLAGTVAAAAAVAVGLPAAIPSSPTADAASHRGAHPSGGTDAAPAVTPDTSSAVAASPVFTSGAPTTTSAAPSGTVVRHHRDGKKAKRGRHAAQAAAADTTTTVATGTDPLTPVVAAPSGTVVLPTTPTPLAPSNAVDNLVTPTTPPPAPLATGAAAFVDSALVTWKPPAGSPATGYDIFVGTAPGQESARPLNGGTPVAGTSYLATGLTPGRTYYFTIRGRVHGASSVSSNEVSVIPFASFVPVGHLIGPVVSMASTADGTGYWLATGSGALSVHGSAADLGSTATLALAAPIVAVVDDPSGNGYWEVAADGGVFAFGSARFEGAASRPPTATATGRSPPTAACSPTATRHSTARSAAPPRRRPPWA